MAAARPGAYGSVRYSDPSRVFGTTAVYACADGYSPGGSGALPHCRFAPPLIHFTPDSLTISVPLLLKQQCDRTLGGSADTFASGYSRGAAVRTCGPNGTWDLGPAGVLLSLSDYASVVLFIWRFV
jgi:hypothetical protein